VVGAHRLDLVVQQVIVVELKAIKQLQDIHVAQVRSYLKATGHSAVGGPPTEWGGTCRCVRLTTCSVDKSTKPGNNEAILHSR